MNERQTVLMKRLKVWGPGKDPWFIPPAKRFARRLQFEAERVPFVDADEAWFEMERVKGGWNILRHVEAPKVIVVPELDVSKAWPRFPRTLGECRQATGAHLTRACKACGEQRLLRLQDHCRGFDGWTIEALQRAGFWRCDCGRVAAVSVSDRALGKSVRVEYWFDDCGWILL